MDGIQKVLIKIGRKDLAQEYYLKVSDKFNYAKKIASEIADYLEKKLSSKFKRSNGRVYMNAWDIGFSDGGGSSFDIEVSSKESNEIKLNFESLIPGESLLDRTKTYETTSRAVKKKRLKRTVKNIAIAKKAIDKFLI